MVDQYRPPTEQQPRDYWPPPMQRSNDPFRPMNQAMQPSWMDALMFVMRLLEDMGVLSPNDPMQGLSPPSTRMERPFQEPMQAAPMPMERGLQAPMSSPPPMLPPAPPQNYGYSNRAY